jgi:uncharacterized damage-inducible protein DinB
MSEIPRLQDLLQRIYDGEAFYGDSIATVLADIDAHQSLWIPEGASHCIWQLLRHMTVWTDIIRQRLTSPTLVEISSDEENFPPLPEASHENWQPARDAFDAALKALLQSIANFPEEKLSAQVPGRDYTFYVLLHGAAHHNLYHLGQISMIKAMYKRQHAF